MMRAIILAAGFGTRLYPLTERTPKAFLPIGGKTLIDHLMEKIQTQVGIQEVVIVTNRLFYNDFLEWKKRASYRTKIRIETNNVLLPEKKLGAVRDLFLGMCSKPSGPEDFLVLCADNYFNFPLSHFLLPCLGHSQNGFIGLYDVKDKEKARLYGVVEMDNHHKIVGFEEKPGSPKSKLVSLGVYYLPSQFLLRVYQYLEIEHLNPDRIGDFIGWLINKEAVYGIEFDGTWFDIGSIESYQQANQYWESLNG